MGNRLSKIYTKTGDDGRRYSKSQCRASCADCSEPCETRGFRTAPTVASWRLRADLLSAWSCR